MRQALLAATATLVMFSFLQPAVSETSMGAGLRESLVTQDNLDRLSVGADYLRIKRDIKFTGENRTDPVRADAYSLYVGYDPFAWLTVFATAGAIEFKEIPGDVYDSGSRWSAGLNANLWHINVNDPIFMQGQCSVVAMAEYGEYNIDGAGKSVTLGDTFAALTVNYEIYAEDPAKKAVCPYSLRMSAGPAISYWDGSARIYGERGSFRADREAGVVAGADAYLSHNLAFGCHVHYFGSATVNAVLRYHF